MNIYTFGALFTDSTAQKDDLLARLTINIATGLAILCWIFVALFLVSCVTPTLRKKFSDAVSGYVFFLLWLVPCSATFLSLFFSDVIGWAPCRLCWYQRGFMYSLAILMLVYWFKRIKPIRIIGYILASVGPMISLYHVGVERGWFDESTSCSTKVPCSSPWFHSMGFLTIAGMAFTAFITVLVLLYLSSRVENEPVEEKA